RNTVDAILVADQVTRDLIPREGFGDLPCNPFRGWVRSSVDPDQVPAAQTDDDQGIEQVEAKGWDNEQVYGSNVGRVVAKKGAPPLARQTMPLDHVLGDAQLRDLKPELEQFAMDARRAPKRVLDAFAGSKRAAPR
ncbi:MAG: hypothetical protein WBE96_14815, partial [Pseudolabrys sp.]